MATVGTQLQCSHSRDNQHVAIRMTSLTLMRMIVQVLNDQAYLLFYSKVR